MKNILFSMSLLGILINPLTAGEIWSLSDDPTDTYTINNPLPNGFTATSIQDINSWLDTEYTNDPAGVMKQDTNLGRVWSFSGVKLVSWTTLQLTLRVVAMEIILLLKTTPRPHQLLSSKE